MGCLKHIVSFFVVTIIMGITLCEASLAQAAPMNLLPHKAVYDVKLVSAKNGSQIINIRGTMDFSWQPSCTGWITRHGFKIRYDYADADASTISSNYTTFENFDSKMLNFNSRQSEDNKVIEVIAGKATKLQAVFTAPTIQKMPLAKGTLFPTEHTMTLLSAAKQGKLMQHSHVFDGSDTTGAVDISTIISPAQKGELWLKPNKAPMAKAINTALLKGQTYRLRMAFFSENETDVNADYEMSLLLHENGVISDMIIDYKDFSLSQKLVSLTEIPKDECGRTGKP